MFISLAITVFGHFCAVSRDRCGGVAIIFAIATLPLLTAGGLAIDASMAYMLKNEMAKALDTAGLAAGRVAFETYAADDAEKFFYANFDGTKYGASVTDFLVTFDASRETITLSASATMDTQFMHLFGYDNVAVGTRAVVQRANKGMELVLVMDNTGSMRSGGKMDATKAAAHDLIDIIYGSETALPDVWVSLVPYSITVNIGAARTNWLDPADRANTNPTSFGDDGWKGCVEARTAPRDQNDAPPTGNWFTSYYYAPNTDNVWLPIDDTNEAMDNGTGPNLGCGPAITPLTPDRATMEAAIDQMQPWHRGGTAGNLGLAWAWRVVSPAWRGIWGGDTPADMPLAYDEPLTDKVVVMMTDGQNQFYDWLGGGGAGPDGSDYTAYGRLTDFGYATLDAARQELDNRMANTCALMKAEGIIIYTLTFGSTPSAATQNLYANCATTNAHYFHAPSNAELSDAFRTIGTALSNLRIAE